MYHGIIIDKQFTDESFPNRFKVFANKADDDWQIFGIECNDQDLDEIIKLIQENINVRGNWYCHFYNDEELIVVFKEKIFRVKPHISTWSEILKFGKTIGIPDGQLDFWPNRFQDEGHYFN